MSNVSGSKLLIVDDMMANRDLLDRVLGDEYHTTLAKSGEEALEIVVKSKPDIILLDIKMSGIDGYEVCRRLKNDHTTMDIPVIFITGHDQPDTVGKCFRLGGVDFIGKPFDLQEVKARVRTHLMLRKATSALVEQNRLLEERVKEQRLNSQLARQVLELIGSTPPRLVHLGDSDYLCINVMTRSCHEEGGDHYLISALPSQNGGAKTIISLKDQSGHSVNCILRSIITDLLHNSTFYTTATDSLSENVAMLNNAICATNLFNGDDFFTAIFLELDHHSRVLHYISAGHPAFLLLRQNRVTRIPKPHEEGANLPIAFQENIHFAHGHISLQPGDKILLFTDGLTDLPVCCQGSALTPGELIDVVKDIIEGNPEITLTSLMHELPTALLQKGGVEDTESGLKHLADDVTMIGFEYKPLMPKETKEFIPANYKSIDSVVDGVIDYVADKLELHQVSIDPYRLRMVLNEGVINAWRHGNSGSGDKPIIVGWHLSDDICLTIKDTGSGFDYHTLSNPTWLSHRNLLSGRGIFCMKKYADFITWQDDGSTLVIMFKQKSHPWDIVSQAAAGTKINLWQSPLNSV